MANTRWEAEARAYVVTTQCPPDTCNGGDYCLHDLAAFAREVEARMVEPTDADQRRYHNDVLFYNVVNQIVQHIEYNRQEYEVADADAVLRVAGFLLRQRAARAPHK